MLSTIQNEADIRKAALTKSSPGDPLIAQIDAIKARAAQLQASMTSNPRGDQDDDFLRDLLRERVQSLIFTFDTFKTPTAAQQREGTILHALTNDRVKAADQFMHSELRSVDAALQQKGLQPLEQASTPARAPAS